MSFLSGGSANGSSADLEAVAGVRFLQSLALAGVAPDTAEGVWAKVRDAHAEGPGRVLHTLWRTMQLLEFYRKACKAGVTPNHTATVELTLWLHDLVLEDSGSEGAASVAPAASAAAAWSLLAEAGVDQSICARVSRYITCAGELHHLAGDTDSELLLDCMMSPLGAPFARYAELASRARREASALSDAEFCRRRAAALRALIDREQLCMTEAGRAMIERQARINMTYEWKLAYAGVLLHPDLCDAASAGLAEVAEGPEAAEG